jgi:hypothetical protein
MPSEKSIFLRMQSNAANLNSPVGSRDARTRDMAAHVRKEIAVERRSEQTSLSALREYHRVLRHLALANRFP